MESTGKSNTTTENWLLGNDTPKLERSIARLCQIYIFPLIFVIGLIGNGLSFAVMTRKSLRGQVASFYISLLAVLDTITLSLIIVPRWILVSFEVEVIAYSQTACKIWSFSMVWMSDSVSWIVSLIAIDRFVNIIFPHKAKTLITLKRSIWMSIVVILFLFVINLQLLFAKQLVIKHDIKNKTYLHCGFSSTSAYFIFTWIDLACFCVIPFTIISFCNAAIIFRLYLKKSRSVEQKMTSITLTLILVSLCLLICTLPFEIYQLSVKEWPDKTTALHETDFLYLFSNFLLYINNSINFFVYCLVGTSFRGELCKLLCRNRVEPTP